MRFLDEKKDRLIDDVFFSFFFYIKAEGKVLQSDGGGKRSRPLFQRNPELTRFCERSASRFCFEIEDLRRDPTSLGSAGLRMSSPTWSMHTSIIRIIQWPDKASPAPSSCRNFAPKTWGVLLHAVPRTLWQWLLLQLSLSFLWYHWK